MHARAEMTDTTEIAMGVSDCRITNGDSASILVW
jgi:hypothetical protein